ncbi:uncharacterized protein A4U43_C03F8410 [Asparagus officinalis]|uniref:F-box domain-containing protein n=1 Tax=Asparagus officinalis TaxID=4686 RepID=A0A5P1F940_ASPOF|nr:putative F-box/FBD/LRR-repeat protein At4g03220 [Asparagus officinalis]ONK74624.1 uncharacterized protein A4U43_C03F8410 [Asparagus officinalis]
MEKVTGKCRHKLEDGEILTKDENEQSDQISKLCNAIIHHILSFLPVRDAAKTSILSKRWRKLFHSMPILDFDQKTGGALMTHPNRALVDFMSASIFFREHAPINLLRISLDYSSSFYFPIRQWIHISMKFNVLEMYLDFSGGDSFLQYRTLYVSDKLQAYYCADDNQVRWDYDSNTDESDSAEESDSESDESSSSDSDDESQNSRFIILPALFNSGSLRVLKLAKCNIPDADSMALGNLICLVLRDVDISEKMLHQMLSSCCMLENLELRLIPELKKLEFSAPKLLSMTLECCHSLKKVSIDAQGLQYFKFGLSNTTKDLSLQVPSLVKAEIGLCHNINCNVRHRADRLVNLLKDLSHVKDLSLYSKFLNDMSIPKSQMKNFTMPTVRRFKIIGKMRNDTISAMFGLVKAFDNLESLHLFIVHPSESDDVHLEEKQLRKLKSTSISCLESRLKELKVEGFEGTDIEIKLIKFLVDYCKVLAKVDIETYTPSFLTHGEIKANLLNQWSSKDLEVNYN